MRFSSNCRRETSPGFGLRHLSLPADLTAAAETLQKRREEHRVRSSGTWCLFLCVKEVKLMWCWSPGPVVSVRLEVASSFIYLFIYLIIEKDLCLLWTEDWPVKDRKEEQEAERWRSCSIICNKKAASSSVAAVIWKKNQAESCGKNRLCEEIFLQVKKKKTGGRKEPPP